MPVEQAADLGRRQGAPQLGQGQGQQLQGHDLGQVDLVEATPISGPARV